MKTEAAGLNTKPRRTWKVIPFEHTDLPALGLYFKEHFPSGIQYGSMGLFQWRAVENYLMPGIINLIKDGEKIVATLSNTPKKLFVKGEGRLVAEIGDANTDPHYQRQGMLSLLINQSTRDALDKGIQGVYSTPDIQTPSLPAFIQKANFLPQPGLDIQSLLFPIDISPLVQRHTHWLLGRWMGSFFLTMVYLYYLVMKGFHQRGEAFSVAQLEELPDDWDTFWDKARASYDSIFDRSRQALTWRFFRNPEKYKFYIVKNKDEILGYIVYRIVNDESIRRIIVADFIFLPGCQPHFRLLLLKVFEEALRIGANSILTWCIKESDYYKLFKQFGFMKRRSILLIWFQNDFAVALRNGHRWHFTISDSDNV